MSRKRKTKVNPQWVQSLIQQYCDQIHYAAKKYNLPLPLLDGQCVIDPRSELGEGSYGVVYETDSFDCVFKATTDSSEAHFIQTAINLRKDKGVDPEGIVDYRAVFALPREAKHDGLEVFVLWREQAVSVGLPETVAKADRSMIKFIEAMAAYYDATEGDPDKNDAGAFWLAVQQQGEVSLTTYWAWLKERVALANRMIDGTEGVSQSEMANRLFRAYVAAEQMEESGPDGRHVGRALLDYFRSGLLICDLHADNVGIVRRKGKEFWCLSDPGHVMALDEKIRDVAIPTLR